jgi:hypothetical protein
VKKSKVKPPVVRRPRMEVKNFGLVLQTKQVEVKNEDWLAAAVERKSEIKIKPPTLRVQEMK